jgi:hypothetical protein
MKQTKKNTEKDNQLADYTDRVLAGRSRQPESRADEEMRTLEETILRLKRVLPQAEMNEASVQGMESRLMARIRQERRGMAVPFWQKWFGWNGKYGRFRPQVAVAAGLLVLAAFAILGALAFPANGSSVVAAAFSKAPAILTAIALAGLIILLVWIGRRK